MKTIYETIPTGTLEEFADAYGLVMRVGERPKPAGSPTRFYAYFESCEVMSNGCLCGEFGDGITPAGAIAAYARRISLTRIALGAYTEKRRDIQVWRLTPEKGE